MADRIADVMALDVDVVLTKAGHRPEDPEIDPDSNLAEILGLVKAIDWERNEDLTRHMATTLRDLAERSRARARHENPGD
jgi:hypothetical protein